MEHASHPPHALPIEGQRSVKRGAFYCQALQLIDADMSFRAGNTRSVGVYDPRALLCN
jgi:hypothetical protein